MIYRVGELLVADSFNRGDQSGLGSTDATGSLGSLVWQGAASSFSISDNKAACTGTAAARAAWVETGVANVRVQVTIAARSTLGNIGLTIRHEEPSSEWWCGYDRLTVPANSLWMIDHPNPTDTGQSILLHGTSGGTVNPGDVITVDCFADEWWVWKNGVLVGNSGGGQWTATKHGLWQNNNAGSGALDEFSIWALYPAGPGWLINRTGF